MGKLNRRYFKYLKGKRVALVGPAGYLMEGQNGAEIDAHDVVVRLNNSFPLPELLCASIGSRTDVVYHTCGRIKGVLCKIGEKAKNGIEVLQKDGVKWWIAKHDPSTGANRNKRKTQRFLKFNEGRIPTIYISHKLLHELQKSLKETDPNMGTLAIKHLLLSKLSVLSIYGIDFGKTGYYTGYTLPPGFEFNTRRTRILTHKGRKKHRGPHDKTRQIIYLRSLFKQDARVRIDEYLKAILERG
jgi:hypothetical protein